jgi:hypothetical protein
MKSLVRAACIASIACSVLVVPGAAQKTAFDPARDLDGFRQRAEGPFADAYALDVYTGLAGAELNATLLEDVRKRWLEERTKVDAIVAGDAWSAGAWMVAKRVARHPALKRLALAEDRSRPPFVVHVQREGPDSAAHSAEVAALHGEWLLAAHAVVQRDLLLASGAKLAPGRGAIGVVLLATRSVYEDLQPDLGVDGWSNTASWDRARRLVVGCDDDHNKKAPQGRVRGVVREAVRALLEAHVSAPDGTLGDLWLEQGLVLRHAQCREPDAASLGKPAPRQDLLTRLAQEAQVAERRAALFLPLERLVGVADSAGLEKAFLDQAEERGVPAAAWDDCVVVAWAQSEAWMHFLLDGRDGRRRAALARYFGAAARGERGWPALQKTMGGESSASLHDDFAAWLGEQWKAAATPGTEGGALHLGLYPAAGAARAGGGAARATQGGLDEGESMLAHAAAFAHAASGAFGAAKAAFDELLASAPTEPWASRARRDLERIEEALRWRAGMEAALSLPGAKLVLERGGRKHNLVVESLADGRLALAPGKSGVASIALEEIAPADWLRQSFKKGDPLEPPPMLRAWLGALAGDPKWDRPIEREVDERALALKEDAFVWYPEMLKSAVAAGKLAIVDALPGASDRASAEALLAAIEAALEHRKLAFVAQREGELLARARLALQIAAQELGPADVTRAEVANLADGRIKVRWGFEDARQLDDIEHESAIGQDQLRERKKLSRLRLEPQASIENSALVLRGPGVWALPLSLEAPYSIKLKLKVKDDLQKEIKETPYFGILHSVAGPQRWILTDPFGGVVELDEGSGMSRDMGVAPGRKLLIDESTTIQISHEGVNMSCGADGKWTSTLNAMRRRAGRVYLVAVGDYALRVEDIEIEGKVDRSWYATMRAEWIERQYARLAGKGK